MRGSRHLGRLDLTRSFARFTNFLAVVAPRSQPQIESGRANGAHPPPEPNAPREPAAALT